MRHPDEGHLLAHLDGELPGGAGEELRSHLAACPPCRARMDGLRRAGEGAARALALLDAVPRTREARAALQARLSGQGGDATRRSGGTVAGRWGWWLPLSLPRAASIVLLLAGTAAAAVPGSPVREWIVRGWEAVRSPEGAGVLEEGTDVSGAEAGETAPQPTSLETGATLRPEGGAVEMRVHQARPGAEVTVAWVLGDQAGIFAGAGTRYRTEAGTVEAFAPPGPVRVELPRGIARASVTVNGVTLYRRTGEGEEALGEVVRRTEGEVVLRIPAGAGSGPNAPLP